MLTDYFAEAIYPEGTESEKALINKILESALEGNLCVHIEEGALPEKIVADNPEDLIPRTPLCKFNDNYYLQKNWVFETRFLKFVKQILSKKVEQVPMPHLENLNVEQQNAVKLAFEHPLVLITGGPGTGKTYTAVHLVKAYLEKFSEAEVIIAAPTGKAVSRLESAFESSKNVRTATLHALFGLSQNSTFLEEGSIISADLILIDECSMIDAALFSHLVASIPDRARLVLMGDGDQLSAVESGSFFTDLKESGKVPCASLTQCLRSSEETIISLAKAVNEADVDGVLPQITSCDLWKEVIENFPGPFYEERSYKELLHALEKFKILSCVRKGPFGVDTLNELIFRYFLEKMQPDAFLAVPILITKNDYNLGLFNGDAGVLIRAFSEKTASYAFFSSGKKIGLSLLPSFEYAYALSVHKSQGSEYDKVLLLVPVGSEVFGKEVLYTAITRAKKTILIDGDRDVIRMALQRSSKRLSGVKERLE
ncbi:MAG: exodeoxyribonuclease V subunit alpha [Chlamydiota bacterium]